MLIEGVNMKDIIEVLDEIKAYFKGGKCDH